jgi:hypothetical protein
LNEAEWSFPTGPAQPQRYPESFIEGTEHGAFVLGTQYPELLPQSHVFKQEVVVRTEGTREEIEQEPQRVEHDVSGYFHTQNIRQTKLNLMCQLDSERRYRACALGLRAMPVAGICSAVCNTD